MAMALLMSSGAQFLFAAGPVETRAFRAAAAVFEDKVYSAAERQFSDFLNRYPNSDFRAEAVLLLARSRFHQSNYDGAALLLEAELPQAGNVADQYHFWLGENAFQSGSFESAIEHYERLLQGHSGSAHFLEAAYNQALAASKMGDWERVAALLGAPQGHFQSTAQVKPSDRFAIHGNLLLGEALFNRKQWSRSEQVLGALSGQALPPDSKWRQAFLLCKVQLAAGRLEAALLTSSNLLQSASGLGRPRLTAEANALQGEILEKLNHPVDAVSAYEKNLADSLPLPLRRQALYKIVELNLAHNKTDEAVARLEKFVEQYPNDVTLDLALFTLGELRLKQVFSSPQASGTLNLVVQAQTNFNRVLIDFPHSEFIGRAFLNRGWCGWILERFDEALRDFAEAVARLPVSEDQAIARYKLADCLFKQQNYSESVRHYKALVADYSQFPAVRETLFDQALYQTVRASLAMNDPESAQDAMERILKWYPHTGYAERSLLLVGQDLSRKGSPGEALKLFREFVDKAPQSPLLPEVKLAIARTCAQEGLWEQSTEILNRWIFEFPGHQLLAHAEFSRALAVNHAGSQTKALELFAAFIERFPSNSLAAQAQYWIADHYYNLDEFALAEHHYQLVKGFNPSLELASQARMGAGRAAYSRQGFKEAREYFLELINDPTTPAGFLADSYIALGDVSFVQFLAETNKSSIESTNLFDDAIKAFSKVAKDYFTNAVSLQAIGRRADSYAQWAFVKDDVAKVELAMADYQSVLQSPLADPASRAQAAMGLGLLLEKQGRMDDAWDRYASVVYFAEDETYDPRWVKEAGLAAARLCESREQWDQAIHVYRRLQALLPALKPTVERRISLARGRLESSKN